MTVSTAHSAPKAEPAPTPSAKARQDYSGPEFLKIGFRPFFLASGLAAAALIFYWLGVIGGQYDVPGGYDPTLWHVHEMLFGFAVTPLTGFLLTAIPNWTGRLPVRGLPLALLALLWLAGRIAIAISSDIGVAAAAVIDLSFLVALMGVTVQEIIAGKNWKNLVITGLIGILALANLLMHLEFLGIYETGAMGYRLGIAAFVLLLSLIGGRIVPSFTRNWLAKQGKKENLPAQFSHLDRGVILVTLLALVTWVVMPTASVTGGLMAVAAIGQFARVWRWQGRATLAEPLVVILHIAYGWISLGFALLAASVFWPGLAQSDALHALTMGAMATMMLAVMTRAALGHSGRALTAGRGTIAIFGLVTLAVLFRLVSSVSGEYVMFIMLSGVAWIAAFLLFVVLYLPVFFGKRH